MTTTLVAGDAADFTLRLDLANGGIELVPIVLDFSDMTADELALIAGVAGPSWSEPTPEIAAFMIFLKACRGRPWLEREFKTVYPILLGAMKGDSEHLVIEGDGDGI